MRRAKAFSSARAYGGLSVPLRSDFEFKNFCLLGRCPHTNGTRIDELTILQGAILAHKPALNRCTGRMVVAVEYNCPHG